METHVLPVPRCSAPGTAATVRGCHLVPTRMQGSVLSAAPRSLLTCLSWCSMVAAADLDPVRDQPHPCPQSHVWADIDPAQLSGAVWHQGQHCWRQPGPFFSWSSQAGVGARLRTASQQPAGPGSLPGAGPAPTASLTPALAGMGVSQGHPGKLTWLSSVPLGQGPPAGDTAQNTIPRPSLPSWRQGLSPWSWRGWMPLSWHGAPAEPGAPPRVGRAGTGTFPLGAAPRSPAGTQTPAAPWP